jgi:hypothetical protein
MEFRIDGQASCRVGGTTPGFQIGTHQVGATARRRAPDARPSSSGLSVFARSVGARELQIIARRDMAMHRLDGDVVMVCDADTQGAEPGFG